MAKKENLTSGARKKLEAKVAKALKEHGYKARVELEPSGLPGHYRLFVVSPDFQKLSEAERQDILWRILKAEWGRGDQLRITLSLMLTDKETQGTWS